MNFAFKRRRWRLDRGLERMLVIHYSDITSHWRARSKDKNDQCQRAKLHRVFSSIVDRQSEPAGRVLSIIGYNSTIVGEAKRGRLEGTAKDFQWLDHRWREKVLCDSKSIR